MIIIIQYFNRLYQEYIATARFMTTTGLCETENPEGGASCIIYIIRYCILEARIIYI